MNGQFLPFSMCQFDFPILSYRKSPLDLNDMGHHMFSFFLFLFWKKFLKAKDTLTNQTANSAVSHLGLDSLPMSSR